MKRSVYKHVESILIGYSDIDKTIAEAVAAVAYRPTDRDENVGGGRSTKTSKAVESLAIALADSPHINVLKLHQAVIADRLKHADDKTVQLIKLCYFDKPRKTVEEVEQLGLVQDSTKSLRRLRRDFIESVARGLGWQ